MSCLCPKPCGRLSAAAVFIAAGVVQVVAGVVLLRSKTAYLLAGPDFWTAAANIAVGSLLGIAASIWKRTHKRHTAKHIARHNLLAALLVSSIVVNATTATILVLGENSALVGIHLLQHVEKAKWGEQLLGYAYVTSVICPVVCLAVAVVALSGGCCRCSGKKKGCMKPRDLEKRQKKIFQANDPRLYGWVFTPERKPNSDGNYDSSSSSSSSSSSGSDYDSSLATTTLTIPSPAAVSSVTETEESLAGTPFSRSTSDERRTGPIPLGEILSIIHERKPRAHPISDHALPVHVLTDPSTPKNNTNDKKDCKVPNIDTTGIYAIPMRCRASRKSVSFNNFNFGEEKPTFSSFEPSSKERLRAELQKQYAAKSDCNKHASSKWMMDHHRLKISPMEAIVELPAEEPVTFNTSPSLTSGYGTSPEVMSNNSIVVEACVGSLQKPRSLDEETTPKRLAGEEAIKRRQMSPIRNPVYRYKTFDYNAQSHDIDSLVGLSHLELLARQRRTWAVHQLLQRKLRS